MDRKVREGLRFMSIKFCSYMNPREKRTPSFIQIHFQDDELQLKAVRERHTHTLSLYCVLFCADVCYILCTCGGRTVYWSVLLYMCFVPACYSTLFAALCTQVRQVPICPICTQYLKIAIRCTACCVAGVHMLHMLQ